jgi:signal recognition particle receptor subunit alpha
VRALFSGLYRDRITQPNKVVQEYPFDPYFERQIQELEKLDIDSGNNTAELDRPSTAESEFALPPQPELRKPPTKPSWDTLTSTDASPIPTPESSRPSSPAVNHLLTAKGGPKGSRRARKAANAAASVTSAPVSSGDESPARIKQGSVKGKKKMRKWDADGLATEDDDVVLDYSSPAIEAPGANGLPRVEAVDQNSWGSRNKQGQFVLKDIGDEMDAILQSANAKKEESETSSGLVSSGLGAIGGLFRNVLGGKTLTTEDLEKPLKGMEDHLLKKNVAREAAVRLCESVERDLVGMKTGSFTSESRPPNFPMQFRMY